MNTKTFSIGLLSAVLASSVLFTTSVSAFWPFDALFNKGEVKAVVTDAVRVGVPNPQNSKAFMTYQTLVSMNNSCREMFSRDYPTPTPIRMPKDLQVKSQSERVNPDSAKDLNTMYPTEFGIDKNSERELTSIYSNLKSRCDNIANLTTRMQKIYKGNVKPTVGVSVTSSPKMKCDLSSRVKNYGCPMDMKCDGEYCQPANVIPTTEPTLGAGVSCGGIRGTKCPDGYTCSYKTESNKLGKMTVDAMGTCIKLDTKEFNIKGR